MKILEGKNYPVLPPDKFKLFSDLKTTFPTAESALGELVQNENRYTDKIH